MYVILIFNGFITGGRVVIVILCSCSCSLCSSSSGLDRIGLFETRHEHYSGSIHVEAFIF